MKIKPERKKIVVICPRCGEQHLRTISGEARELPPSLCKKCREKGKFKKDNKGKLRRTRP